MNILYIINYFLDLCHVAPAFANFKVNEHLITQNITKRHEYRAWIRCFVWDLIDLSSRNRWHQDVNYIHLTILCEYDCLSMFRTPWCNSSLIIKVAPKCRTYSDNWFGNIPRTFDRKVLFTNKKIRCKNAESMPANGIKNKANLRDLKAATGL